MRNEILPMLAATLCLLPVTLPAQQEIADDGDFLLQFHPGQTEYESSLRAYLMSDGMLEELIDDINSEINLRHDVEVIFAPGSLIAAHWNLDPGDTVLAAYQDGQILYSYAKVTEAMDLFRRMDDFDDTQEDFEEKILPVIGTTILHEIGHALIHINGIALGPGENEEVVADQLAFFLVSGFYDAAEDFMPVVLHYAYRAEDPERGAAAPSPHPQDETRAQNYLCWMYGSDPELFAGLAEYVEYGADYCVDAYYDLWGSWQVRLDPSWKDSAEPDAEAFFYYLVDEEGYSLDDAIVEVAGVYDLSVAVDLGVYLCAPAPDDECADSGILATWAAFGSQLEAGNTAYAAVTALIEQEYSAELLMGIGVYWCSPDPGPGCTEEDPFVQAWAAFDYVAAETGSPSAAIAYLSDNVDPFVAELVGVYVCGHPSCYQGEELVYQAASVAHQPLRPSGLKRDTPKRRSNVPPRRSARN